MAQAAPAKQNKKQKKQPIKLNFSELDDPFLLQKGKALRNIQKKLDKYQELDRNQKEQIASIPALKEEMTELDTLCRLYMDSNPNFDKSSPSISQEDVDRAVRDALSNVSRVQTLSALVAEDSSLVEMSANERDTLDWVNKQIANMQESASKGSDSFQASLESANSFVDVFAKMASSSSDIVDMEATEGVSFADFNSAVKKCFGEDDSGIAQRISAKAEEAKKAAEAEAEAARAAEEAQKKADAAAAKEAARQKREQERAAALEAKKAAQAESAQTAENKDASEVKAEGEKDVAAAEGQQDAAAYTESRGGRGGRGDRGDRRGGRREYDGERPRREYDPERRGRGNRGEYRGRGRGGYRQNKNEDDEGFVVETGEKPKRGRGNYRGRGRGGERGEYRGGRGDRRTGDWDANRGSRGGRPQTANGGENAAAAQETQPAAQIGAQASTTSKVE